MTLEHRHRVYRLPEVPQPEGRILGRGDDQPLRRVGSRMCQLIIVAGQLMDQLTCLTVPDAGQPVPTSRDSVVASGQPVCGDYHSLVACVTKIWALVVMN